MMAPLSMQTKAFETNGVLVRAMTRWDLTALALNGLIGAGIFGLPSSAARMLGVASPIAFVLCAVIVYVIVLCFAESAGYFTETGGPYLYSRTVFGRFIGFEVGWALWLSRVTAFAANSNLLVSYLGFFSPRMTSAVGRTVILTAVPAILMMINIRGVKAGATFSSVLAIL